MRTRIETENGFIYHCSIGRLVDIRNARKAKGLPMKEELFSCRVENHPLLGKTVTSEIDEDKSYTVDYATKIWHWGYYVVLALVNPYRSHRCACWESLGTIDETILDSIKENRKELKVLD